MGDTDFGPVRCLYAIQRANLWYFVYTASEIQTYRTLLTGSWGSADLERRPRPTLISGCYSSLCEEKGQRKTNKRQIGIEPETESVREGGRKNETLRSAQATSRSETQRSAQYMYLLMYSHPPQLLIRRKSPSWDHLDGVLLQSSGTKHTHRPLRSGINIPLSQCYLCCILDWCSFPVCVCGGGALVKGNIFR